MRNQWEKIAGFLKDSHTLQMCMWWPSVIQTCPEKKSDWALGVQYGQMMMGHHWWPSLVNVCVCVDCLVLKYGKFPEIFFQGEEVKIKRRRLTDSPCIKAFACRNPSNHPASPSSSFLSALSWPICDWNWKGRGEGIGKILHDLKRWRWWWWEGWSKGLRQRRLRHS